MLPNMLKPATAATAVDGPRVSFAGKRDSRNRNRNSDLSQHILALRAQANAAGERGTDLHRLADSLADSWRRRWSAIGGAA